MNRLAGIFFCFLILHAASAQTTGSQHAVAGKSYLDYYQAIARAEEAVVEGSYADALQQYHTVFGAYPYNNPIDCYIAAQVAAYNEDTLSCSGFVYKGLCFGLPLETIAGNPHLEPYLKEADPHRVDSCLHIYRSSIDLKARAAMLALFRRDQAIIHDLPPDESIYGSDGRTLRSQYRPVWDSLLREVILLTRDHGFPAQKIIGTQNGEDSIFRISPQSSFALYIFIHHGNAWSQAGDMLWAELLQGNITPQMYGAIYQHASGKDEYDNPVLYFASRPCQQKRCRKLVQEKREEIDSARRSIGLCSYEVMEQKFASRHLYYKWLQKKSRKKEPFFDFECDLNFQRISGSL